MTLHDFTDDLGCAERTWGRGGRTFFAQFRQEMQDAQVGLYVLVLKNDSPFAVYDRNGEGRVLIDPNSVGVKYGKFEKGFLARRHVDHKHLHRRCDDQSEEADIFVSLLRYALVLDLSAIDMKPVNPAAVFEPYWNAMLEAVLSRNHWLAPGQSAQSEWRRIVPGAAWEAIQRELATAAPDLRARIEAAALVLAGRQPQ